MSELTTNRSQSTTKCSQLSTLAELFPNPTLVKVLSLFLLHPEKEFYQRGIAETTGNALVQVQRALKRIERTGLVTKTRVVSDATADEILEEAKAFKEEAINWLRANHPDLLKRP